MSALTVKQIIEVCGKTGLDLEEVKITCWPCMRAST